MSDKYAEELDRVAAMLTEVHDLGVVKAIGRMECAAALSELIGELRTLRAEEYNRQMAEQTVSEHYDT